MLSDVSTCEQRLVRQILEHLPAAADVPLFTWFAAPTNATVQCFRPLALEFTIRHGLLMGPNVNVR